MGLKRKILMLCENFKEKNENSIRSELPKTIVLQKVQLGPLGVKQIDNILVIF